jgi:hypothetical protein
MPLTWMQNMDMCAALTLGMCLAQPQRNADEIDIDDDDDDDAGAAEKAKASSNQQLGRLDIVEKAAPASLYGDLLQVRLRALSFFCLT